MYRVILVSSLDYFFFHNIEKTERDMNKSFFLVKTLRFWYIHFVIMLVERTTIVTVELIFLFYKEYS